MREFKGYSVKDWKAKYYPNDNHIQLKDFTKIPNDLVICDTCNKEIRQPINNLSEKVVWVYDGGWNKGNWAICTDCKEHPVALDKSIHLMNTYKELTRLPKDIGDLDNKTEEEIIEMMEPTLRKPLKENITRYGLDISIATIVDAINHRFLERKDGKIIITQKGIKEGSKGFGILIDELKEGDRRLQRKN